MWRDQSDRLFVISIMPVRYIQEFLHFSRDYETLMTLYVVTLTIIEFRWNNSMYVMLPEGLGHETKYTGLNEMTKYGTCSIYTVMLKKSASTLIVLIVRAVFPSYYFGAH